MKITRKSTLSGITRTLDLDITDEQIMAWTNGSLIQDAMSNISNDEREFIMTGCTCGEWEEAYPDEDSDNEDD